MVENTVGKGEIACFEQFLLFPQCFQNICSADTLKLGLVRERVKGLQELVLSIRVPTVRISIGEGNRKISLRNYL